jgi:hypothetical protein
MALGNHRLLNRNPGTLGDENEVCETMDDNGPVVLLDDARQDTQSRWRAGVPFWENFNGRTLLPRNVGCMNGRLHIRPIKVERESLRVGKRTSVSSHSTGQASDEHGNPREAEDIPENGILERTLRDRVGRQELKDAPHRRCGRY